MRNVFRKALSLIMSLIIILRLLPFEYVFAEGIGIDENTVIYADQVESVAGHVGDYGWDSRGAVFKYYDSKGRISGDLGTLMFCDENGIPRDRMWDSWGNRFPDWWGRMLAETVRSSVSTDKIKTVRQAFADSVTFRCYWMIAIGVKSKTVQNGPYLTLRTDGTLRKAYNVDTSKLYPAERLFTGDEMASSLSYLLPKSRWGQISQEVFRERNPYIYKVTINSYMLNIYATDCVKCAKAGKKNGDHCKHNKHSLMLKSVPIEYGNSRYYDENSFVWQGQTVRYSEPEIGGYERDKEHDDFTGYNGTINDHDLTAEKDSRVYLSYRLSDEESEEIEEIEPEEDTVTPSQTITPTPTPTPEAKYFDNEISAASNDTSAQAVICSDIFDVPTAVPSTESVYIKGSAKDSLYSIDTSLISGNWVLPVTVGFPYRLIWEDEDGNEMQETGIIERSVLINRDYVYLHLNRAAYYQLDTLTVENPALSPSRITISAEQTGAHLPSVSEPVVYGSDTPALGENIDLPGDYSSYIYAGGEIEVHGGSERPDIPEVSEYEAYVIAESSTGQMQCRNDEFYIDGRNVLGDAGWRDGRSGSLRVSMRTPEIIILNSAIVYGPDHITIPVEKRNGRYDTSLAKIHYRQIVSYGNTVIHYNEDMQVNHVNVHTPVICKAFIGECTLSDPNSAYFQEQPQNGRNGFILVQGESDSPGADGKENKTQDFVITFSNSGNHPQYVGQLSSNYDYSKNLNGLNGGTYIKGNYIRFPFVVYMDTGNDLKKENDRKISANTWVYCENGQRFYLGSTVKEGYYNFDAMTAAVNSISSDLDADDKPRTANARQTDHTATDSITVYVSGKLYGLTLYDITSENEWKDIFSYNGNNKYRNMIPLGRSFQNWPQNDATMSTSSPSGKYGENEVAKMLFYYTSGNKNEIGEKTGRDNYGFPLIAGSHPLRNRTNKGMLKAGYEWKFRIRTTGYTMNRAGSSIVIKPTYWVARENGIRKEAELYYETDSDHIAKFEGEVTVWKPSERKGGMQAWDFSFRLPGRIHVILKENSPKLEEYLAKNKMVDFTEDFWCRNEYFAVNFEISALDEDGKEFLYYSPQNGRCNMWITEGQDITKPDYYGKKYRFDYGDIALIDIEKGAMNDYMIDHQN